MWQGQLYITEIEKVFKVYDAFINVPALTSEPPSKPEELPCLQNAGNVFEEVPLVTILDAHHHEYILVTRSVEMEERRGSHMYDSARDIFTNSDDAPAQDAEENATERDDTSSAAVESSITPCEELPTQKGLAKASPSEEAIPKSLSAAGLPASTNGKTTDPVPITAAALSKVSAKKREPGSTTKAPQRRHERFETGRRRSRSPQASLESRRRERRSSPLRRRTPSPPPIARSPTPTDRSPPRQRKRPGGAARIRTADAEAVKRRQQLREQEQNELAQRQAVARGVHDVVRQHYNAVPQRGKEWRKTESKIKGLRSFNNWIKSAVIQRYSPAESYHKGAHEHGDQGGLLVLDIGCGKGGDLAKWQQAPQRVDLYVALDPADISIEQARERYSEMQRGGRGGYRNQPQNLFRADFIVKDCFGEWLGTVPIVQEVGIDGSVGPVNGAAHGQRWGGGGFDVVTMMFCMHYAFESEAKARGMLRNVAGSLKKGGRFIGVIPNSDIIIAKVNEYNASRGTIVQQDDDDDWDPEKTLDAAAATTTTTTTCTGDDGATKALGENGDKDSLTWGNSIYTVKFPGKVPEDGVFRPPFGWKYFFYLEEAVEEVPEYVVPWEAFRALAVEYDLELQFRRTFSEVWELEKDDSSLGPLSERMNVRGRDRGPLLVSEEEQEAASTSQTLLPCRSSMKGEPLTNKLADFYHAFCFYKT